MSAFVRKNGSFLSSWTTLAVFAFTILPMISLYLWFAWNRHSQTISSEALMLAQSAEALLHTERIEKLKGDETDLANPEYSLVKQSLTRLVETTNPIRFAYLMREMEGKVIILMDSEAPDSPDYSPPGQVYEEADETLLNTFKTGEAVLTEPTEDRWGTWISALVPIKSSNNSAVTAVFGLDYSATEWKADLWEKMIPDFIIAGFFFLISLGFLNTRMQKAKLEKMSGELAESERSKSVLLSNLPGMAYRCDYDPKWTMRYISAGCKGLTGYPPESLLGNRELSFNDLISPEYRDSLWRTWKEIISRRQPFRKEYEITTAGGERKWVLELGQAVYGEGGEVEALEGIIFDITDRKLAEDQLRFMSERDPLTGLKNLKCLEDSLEFDASTDGRSDALVCVNLSSIHSLNLRYSFRYGLDILKKTSDVLGVFNHGKVELFHIYQYRFVFFLKKVETPQDLSVFCDTLARTLETLLDTERIAIGIGVVELSAMKTMGKDEIIKILMIASEKDMDTVKKDVAISFYDERLHHRVVREEGISRELADIAAGENTDRLFVHYQPVLDLKTGEICSFEALARLNTTSFGIVSPLEFIPLAERTKLIIPLGDRIFSSVLGFSRSLQERGHPNVSVAVNISTIQLLREGFVESLCKMMDQGQVDPRRIMLEITESVFASNLEEVNRILEALKAFGVKIALDDFGREYSSLAREQELNLDCIKIDKYFIEQLPLGDAADSIVEEIISICHKMRHCVVAEGVEEAMQLEYLRAHGCDRAQGHLISRPLDMDAALEFLKAREEKGRPS